MSVRMPAVRTALRLSFVKFAGLSGLGWLLDTAILMGLTMLGVLAAFSANIVSSSTAALSVFLLSREVVFSKAPRALLLRAVSYLVYTLTVILLASALLGELVPLLLPLAEQMGAGRWGQLIAVGVGKVTITPPQLLLNFLVARFFAERHIVGFG